MWHSEIHHPQGKLQYSYPNQSFPRIKQLTQTSKSNGPIAVFMSKMAFLKSKFKDDPVRVQRHTVHHFKGLE